MNLEETNKSEPSYEEFVNFMDKLKTNAKTIKEKDGKIILDKNDPNDVDWWNEE